MSQSCTQSKISLRPSWNRFVVFLMFICGILMLAGCGGDGSSGDEIRPKGAVPNKLTEPQISDVVTHSDGAKLIKDQVALIFHSEHFSDENATALANSENAEVLGKDNDFYLYQFRVSVNDTEDLLSIISRLNDHEFVDVAGSITEFENSSSNSWEHEDDHPSHFGSRDTNRVEEATALFNSSFNLSIAHDRIDIGVVEIDPILDFKIDDLKDFANQKSSNMIKVFATSGPRVTEKPGVDHASAVIGSMIAKIGNGGMGGLLSSYAIERGGFDVHLTGSGFGLFSARATRDLIDNNDIEIVNISFGSKYETGSIISNAVYLKLFNDYPDVLFVVSSLNEGVYLDDTLRAPQWAAAMAPNAVVVGGHRYPGHQTEDTGNFGNFVDISAMFFWPSFDRLYKKTLIDKLTGTLPFSENYCIESITDPCLINFIQGTSFSTPLVTATAASMKSISPHLKPSEIIKMLRSSALPLSEKVNGTNYNSTRHLTVGEVGNDPDRLGKAARLNVEGAIKSAIEHAVGGGSETLNVPSNLSAEAGDSQVVLSWNGVSGASSYKVYLSTVEGTAVNGQVISDVTDTNYTHTGLTNSTEYYYVVRAVGTGGVESLPSAEVSAVPSAPVTGPDSEGFILQVEIVGNGEVAFTGPPSENGSWGTPRCGSSCSVRVQPEPFNTVNINVFDSINTGSASPLSPFIGWSGDGGCSGDQRECTLTLTESTTVTAIFED